MYGDFSGSRRPLQRIRPEPSTRRAKISEFFAASEDETSPTTRNSGVLSGSETVELPTAPNSGISGTAELPSSSVRLRLTAAADLLAISAFLHSLTFRKNDASARSSGSEYST